MNKAALAFCAAVAGAIAQYGCATADVVGAQVLKQVFKPDPTVVSARVRVAEDVNPDSRGRPSPIKVRFYLLRSPGVLQSTGFFDLKDQDRELLRDDLRLREEHVFRPGADMALELKIPAEDAGEDERMFLGVVAGYWKLDESRWQTVDEIEVQETTEVDIEIGHSGISTRLRDR